MNPTLVPLVIVYKCFSHLSLSQDIFKDVLKGYIHFVATHSSI